MEDGKQKDDDKEWVPTWKDSATYPEELCKFWASAVKKALK